MRHLDSRARGQGNWDSRAAVTSPLTLRKAQYFQERCISSQFVTPPIIRSWHNSASRKSEGGLPTMQTVLDQPTAEADGRLRQGGGRAGRARPSHPVHAPQFRCFAGERDR